MGLPATILEEIKSFARDAAEDLPSPEERAAAAKSSFLSSVDEVAIRGQKLRKRTEELRTDLARFVEALAVDHRSIDLDEVVDTLRRTEHDLKELMAPSVNRIKATRKRTFSMRSLTPGQRARAIAAVDHYIAALNATLEMLRDYRWLIMTVRADHEEPGDAPTFDDPDKLVEYLELKSG